MESTVYRDSLPPDGILGGVWCGEVFVEILYILDHSRGGEAVSWIEVWSRYYLSFPYKVQLGGVCGVNWCLFSCCLMGGLWRTALEDCSGSSLCRTAFNK